jgi:hypothetical protein
MAPPKASAESAAAASNRPRGIGAAESADSQSELHALLRKEPTLNSTPVPHKFRAADPARLIMLKPFAKVFFSETPHRIFCHPRN